jgi:rod shape-determining protein MreD
VRWFTFIVLAYFMLGLQIGLGGIAQIGSGQINFVLIAATFIAINARRDPALIACFTLGFLHDLVGVAPLGTYALAYSMIAWLVEGTDRALSPEHPFTHWVVTLFGGVVTAILVYVHGHVASYGVATPLWPGLLGAFYSALAAVPVLWALGKFRKRFRFRSSIGR